MKNKMNTSVIPKGMYCYDTNGTCPYWRRIEDRPEQGNGWCDYLGKGDMELAEETVFEDLNTGEITLGSELPVGIGTGLLWDQCKECGINDLYENEK